MSKKIWIMNHYAISHFAQRGGRHFWIANNLKLDGYEPIVFGCNEMHNSIGSYYDDSKLWQELTSDEGVKFIPIKSSQYMGNGLSRIKNMYVFYRNLKKVAVEYAKIYGKPDIIYASSVHPLTVLAGEKIAKKFNIPVIGEVRDLWPETLVAYGSIKRNSLIAKLLYQGEKYMYKKANAMVFTMEGAPDYIKEHKWDTESGGPIDLKYVYHICNGIDIKQFDENSEKYVLEDEDLDNPDTFCAVYTGAIKRANNLGLLIDMAISLTDLPNFKILIWGEGNEVSMLTQRVKELGLDNIVKFKGVVEKKFIPSIVKRGDVSLMHWERTSVNNYGYDYNKLFDYLAAGKLIFSTIQSGHSLLVNKRCGIETEGRRPEDFARGIRKIYYMDPIERAEWGKRARTVAHDYDFKVLTQKLEEIIEELI